MIEILLNFITRVNTLYSVMLWAQLILKSYILSFMTHLYSTLGCGTGKYLSTNPHVFKVGVDRCLRLTEIARSQDSEVRALLLF